MLNTAGVAVKSALPGVGQHLQDHLSTQLVFGTTEQTAGAMHSSNNFASVSVFCAKCKNVVYSRI